LLSAILFVSRKFRPRAVACESDVLDDSTGAFYFKSLFTLYLQDTFWRRSLLDIDLSANSSAQFNDADIIFDRASETDGSLISGNINLAKADSITT
jgi:hypothetical protein